MSRVAIALLLFGAVLPGASTPVFPVSEVRPGLRGTGRSVFSSGRGIEEFAVEVVDVMHQSSPRGDIILCRLSGADLEHSGVIQGMSGSPVYVDGRLLGAVAYAFPTSKDPICGVTPAAEMLGIWQLEPGGSTGGARGRRRSTLAALNLTRSAPAAEAARRVRADAMTPIPLPVAVSGLNSGLRELIADDFSSLGFVPVAAAGASAAEPDTAALVPGAAVGVALTDGDVRISGIGTLTCREGDRLLAFGHPMFQAGPVRLPLVGGVIHTVLPSIVSSFKLFSPTRPIGVVTEDRAAGISGTIGPVAPMVPVTVRVLSPAVHDTYRFRVADHEALAPTFVAAGVADAVMQSEGTLEDVLLKARLRVSFDSFPDVEVRRVLPGPNPLAELYADTRNLLGVLCDNPFRPAGITGIAFDLDFSAGRDVAWLVGVSSDRRRVAPGGRVRLTLRLRDYRGAETTRAMTITVPRHATAGKLRLLIGSSDSLLVADVTRAPAAYEPRTFRGLLDLLALLGHEDELVVAGYTERSGLVIGATELPAPPASVRSVVAALAADATHATRLFENRFSMGRPVYGLHLLELEVKK